MGGVGDGAVVSERDGVRFEKVVWQCKRRRCGCVRLRLAMHTVAPDGAGLVFSPNPYVLPNTNSSKNPNPNSSLKSQVSLFIASPNLRTPPPCTHRFIGSLVSSPTPLAPPLPNRRPKLKLKLKWIHGRGTRPRSPWASLGHRGQWVVV
uniref:Uncharacterized protein n=1 Tax=Fagus sylvatica TaxID=28930 RepID=A0A2N9G3X2_FAGSY